LASQDFDDVFIILIFMIGKYNVYDLYPLFPTQEAMTRIQPSQVLSNFANLVEEVSQVLINFNL
jgi:hypothetical protein